MSLVCLQNEASFGKSQLLNGSNLANQNKNKKWRENSKNKIRMYSTFYYITKISTSITIRHDDRFWLLNWS